MTLNQLPTGWSPAQLRALDTLIDLNDAYQVAKTIKALLNDTTPEAAQVMTDLANLARDNWAIVKTYGS